jgi:hypothetical protein
MPDPKEVLDSYLEKGESDSIYRNAHVWQDYASTDDWWVNRIGSFQYLTRKMLEGRNYTVSLDYWGKPRVHYHDQKFDHQAREQGRKPLVWVTDIPDNAQPAIALS